MPCPVMHYIQHSHGSSRCLPNQVHTERLTFSDPGLITTEVTEVKVSMETFDRRLWEEVGGGVLVHASHGLECRFVSIRPV